MTTPQISSLTKFIVWLKRASEVQIGLPTLSGPTASAARAMERLRYGVKIGVAGFVGLVGGLWGCWVRRGG